MDMEVEAVKDPIVSTLYAIVWAWTVLMEWVYAFLHPILVLGSRVWGIIHYQIYTKGRRR